MWGTGDTRDTTTFQSINIGIRKCPTFVSPVPESGDRGQFLLSVPHPNPMWDRINPLR